jgi:hypothetical protein
VCILDFGVRFFWVGRRSSFGSFLFRYEWALRGRFYLYILNFFDIVLRECFFCISPFSFFLEMDIKIEIEMLDR